MSRIPLCTFAFLAFLALAFAHLCPAATTDADRSILQDARAVLDTNWVTDMNSTLPSPNLYPHQWSWDAAFVAMGYSHYDTRKAIDEMNALFRGQWKNGLVPSIVFNPSTDESYFPGPSFWRIETSKNAPIDAHTSGVVQPPVHATASLSIYRNAKTPHQKLIAHQYLQHVYPKLVAWHRYLYIHRDPLKEHLVFIRHMWESGMDNSPAWEDALAAIKLHPQDIPAYTRVDNNKVGDHKERPTAAFYDRAVYLIKIYYDNSYDESAIFEKSPFLIQDVQFNSILARAGYHLAEIATVLGKTHDAKLHRAQAARTAAAITAKLFNSDDGYFYDYDMFAKKQIRRRISGGLAALYGAKLEKTHIDALLDSLYSDSFLGPDLSSWTIPSVARDDPAFSNSSYWSGPAWININYLVRDGLKRSAPHNPRAIKVVHFLKDRSLELLRTSGFYEYFSPISGAPYGGHLFSWSASLAIDWICTDDESVANAVPSWIFSADLNSKQWAILFVTLALLTVVILNVMRPAKTLEAVRDINPVLTKDLLKKHLDDPSISVPRSTSIRMRKRNLSAAYRRPA